MDGNYRPSGYVELFEYKNWGGSNYDSRHYADAFRHENPHHFGMQVSKMFSASNKFSDKVLTQYTYASGNYQVIDNDVFRWTLAGDDEVPFYVTEFLEAGNTKPGYNRGEFRIALHMGILQEPDVLMCEDNRFPLIEIVGNPIQVGNSYYYTCRLQTGDPTEWIDPEMLQVGMRFIKASTSIGTEMNQVWGTDAYSSQMELESQIGAFGEKVSFTDKVVRKEIAARKRGQRGELGLDSGYAFDVKQGDKVIKRGAFITMAEARLLDRIEMDCEMSMTFGRASERWDSRGQFLRKTGPGWRQIVKDGHILYHGGDLSAQRIEDFLHGILLGRKSFDDRKIVLDCGEGAMKMIHRIIADEYNSFLTVDTKFTSNVQGVGGNRGLSYGAQFLELQLINGIKVDLRYNPIKDNHKYCGRKHPDDPKFTIDSYRIDIMDFGSTDDGMSNITMVVEDGVDSYAYTGGMVDPASGPVKDGSKVSSFEKGISFEREKSGGLVVFDTSRVGSIIFEPEY